MHRSQSDIFVLDDSLSKGAMARVAAFERVLTDLRVADRYVGPV